MSLRSRVSIKLLLGVFLMACSAPFAWSHISPPPKKGEIGRQEVHAPLADFTLVDQEEKRFRFSSTRGKFVLVTFVFTTCPDICPLFTAKFSVIQRKLQEKNLGDYWLLTVTTDPERDSPAVLKAYAKQYRADLSYWSFLTGSKGELAKVWKAFGVNVKKHGSGQIQHTGLTALIDRHGIRRVNYWGDKWLETDVLKDISSLEPRRRQ